MFNFFKKSQTFDPIQRGSEAGRHASKLAQLVPFRYLLANASDGSVSFTQYTGVFIEQDKVHILNEEERAAVAGLLADLRCKNTPAAKPAKDLGWIPWNGRGCPVRRDTGIDIKLADGRVVLNTVAGSWAWESHEKLKNRIVAYRVVRP